MNLLSYVNTFGGGVVVGILLDRYGFSMLGSAVDNLWRKVWADMQVLWNKATTSVKP